MNRIINDPQERVKHDFDLLTSQGYEVVGVFLQGSQNYNLDYEDSDIDTKAILLPNFEDFLFGRKMISSTIELEPTKEHLDIKDIRLMFQNFKKQNINFLEILFTKYYYINPKYVELFQPMFENREMIARYDVYKALNTMSGMSKEKLKALEHPYPTIKHKIDEFGYDSKQIHHIERLNEFIRRYIDGEKYEDCLIYRNTQHLIRVKRNSPYSLEEAREIAIRLDQDSWHMKSLAQEYISREPNVEVGKIIDDVLINILKEYFRNELTSQTD